MAVLENWERVSPGLRALDPATLDPVPDAQVLAPLTYPRKVLCAGANYYSHAQEMGTEAPNPDGEPFFFLKPPTTTLVSATASVVMPPGDVKLDWEVELAVVIGRAGRDIPESAALDHVAGYTIANDLSARGLFPRSDAVFPPFAFDWLKHKGYDGFCPLGPGIVPHWLVQDPHDMDLSLSVNGVVRQKSSTSDMVVKVPRLISAASRILSLEPGDVILTGTPAGVGMPSASFLSVGDVVVAEIGGLPGRLSNQIVIG